MPANSILFVPLLLGGGSGEWWGGDISNTNVVAFRLSMVLCFLDSMVRSHFVSDLQLFMEYFHETSHTY